MTGAWLLSYVILWLLTLTGAAALLALARELVAQQRELEMVNYQLAHERERSAERASQPVPEAPRVQPT